MTGLEALDVLLRLIRLHLVLYCYSCRDTHAEASYKIATVHRSTSAPPVLVSINQHEHSSLLVRKLLPFLFFTTTLPQRKQQSPTFDTTVIMGVKEIFTDSTLARYGRAIRAAPREVVLSRKMLLSAALYAMAGVPISELHLSSILHPWNIV